MSEEVSVRPRRSGLAWTMKKWSGVNGEEVVL